MRFRPQVEELECRATPSPVIFLPNDTPGVPFQNVYTPGHGPETPNLTG
jgi:hypothetical protein